jgi:hypothetical protein
LRENRTIVLEYDHEEKTMMNRKTAISLTFAGLLAASAAIAVPANEAPRSQVNACVASVAQNADYTDAGKVRHEVETESTGVSRHRMSIHTLVLGENGTEVIREYSASCLVDGSNEVQRFRIRQTGV